MISNSNCDYCSVTPGVLHLLTRCTTVPVPVFCCFSISGFPHIKSAPKIREKSDKKSAYRNLPEEPKWGQRATTRCPGGLPVRTRMGPRQGAAWTPGGPPGCPLHLYILRDVKLPRT